MAEAKKYKIKISPERVLGPLDLARVEALVMKGQIKGTEPTSIEPFTTWAGFSTFPELAELILKKMESDQGIGKKTKPDPKKPSQPSDIATRTIVKSESTKTKTMAGQLLPEQEEEISYGIPTLLDIRAPAKVDPDIEKTKINLTAPTAPAPEDESDGGTKILSVEKMEQALQKFAEPEFRTMNEDGSPIVHKPKKSFLGLGKPIKAEDYYDERTGKKRILTRNTAAILALGLLAIAYLQNQKEVEEGPKIIVPHYFTFPYVEVNNPPRLGDTADATLSATLVDKGQALIEKENPGAYITAIKKYFYLAVGRNPNSVDARSLLASSYIRISEIIPRDSRLFNTLEQLLILKEPAKNTWTPEYVVARAEYYFLKNRFDQAQEIIDAYLKIRPTPELLYQKAKNAFERRDMDQALTAISKAIPPENVQKANPRHLLLYSQLLDRKGQKEACNEALKRLHKESPDYGPGLLFYIDYNFRNGKISLAKAMLPSLIDRPSLLDRVQLADAFVVAAKVLEATNELKRALYFATSAVKFHYDRELAEDIVFRLKSKLPGTADPYAQIVNGRQKEKSKQIDLAINHYIRALEMNRNDPTAYILLARLYEGKGDIYEAVERYKKAKDTPAKPVEAALNLARIYADRFELDKARDMINFASDFKTNRDEISFLKAVIQLKSKRPDLAEPLLDEALASRSRLTSLYIQMGQLESDKADNSSDISASKQHRELAEFYYATALRYEPFNPKATLGVAFARFHLESPSRAIAFLMDKLASQPNSAAIMTNLAVIHLRTSNQELGKHYLQSAIRSDSKYAEAFRLLGNLTKEEGNRQTDNYSARRHSYRYALASYEMYSQLAPNDPEGYKSTGDLYFDIRDLGAAAKNYYKVLELTPNYPEVRLKLALISRNGGDANAAMTLIDQELKINPRSDAAMVEKGNIYMAKKEFSQATNTYTQAARINEKNADALFGLGVVYHLQGNYDNALSLFNRVIKLDPLKADVYWQMALIYQKQNNRPKALQALTNYKGIVRDPESIAKADEKFKEISK